MGNGEFPDCKAKQVHAERSASRGHALAISSEDRGRLAAVPREAAVRKQRDFNRYRAVHPLSRAEGTKQREAELDIADEHPTPHESIEKGTAALGVGHAVPCVERVDVITADEI